jgi:hypothetical protein
MDSRTSPAAAAAQCPGARPMLRASLIGPALLPVLLLVGGLAVAGAAGAQQPTPAPAGSGTCAYQYKDAVGVTPAQLLGRGFEIKTGWPGGLWLQKDKTAYFCNSGRTAEGAVICWTMVEPVSGAACQ